MERVLNLRQKRTTTWDTADGAQFLLLRAEGYSAIELCLSRENFEN
jgi:hypothetical protein